VVPPAHEDEQRVAGFESDHQRLRLRIEWKPLEVRPFHIYEAEPLLADLGSGVK
jgi:hypothetical protein